MQLNHQMRSLVIIIAGTLIGTFSYLIMPLLPQWATVVFMALAILALAGGLVYLVSVPFIDRRSK